MIKIFENFFYKNNFCLRIFWCVEIEIFDYLLILIDNKDRGRYNINPTGEKIKIQK